MITSVFVTSAPTAPDCPVRGIVSPFSAGWLRTMSGVSPCATCQTISPRSRLIAVMPSVRRLQQRQALRRRVGVGRARRPVDGASAAPPSTARQRRRIGADVLAGAGDVAHAGQRVAGHVRHVGELLVRRRQQAEHRHRRERRHVGDVRLGIERAARPVRAARRPEAADRTLALADRRRREDRPESCSAPRSSAPRRAAPA